MTPLPAPLRWLYSLEWRRGFFDWARSDGVTWVYIFKVLIAAFLTLWLAMRLELPQPRTAMITVFIVMQPQSGQVFAKSFYRFLGTLAGSAVMVFLIALFAQNTELFLGSLAIWVGICTAGATRTGTGPVEPPKPGRAMPVLPVRPAGASGWGAPVGQNFQHRPAITSSTSRPNSQRRE